jgi:hypothetical protein
VYSAGEGQGGGKLGAPGVPDDFPEVHGKGSLLPRSPVVSSFGAHLSCSPLQVPGLGPYGEVMWRYSRLWEMWDGGSPQQQM